MSLRYFHICFIILSALLLGGIAYWCHRNHHALAIVAAFAIPAAALPIYGVWFMKKSKSLV